MPLLEGTKVATIVDDLPFWRSVTERQLLSSTQMNPRMFDFGCAVAWTAGGAAHKLGVSLQSACKVARLLLSGEEPEGDGRFLTLIHSKDADNIRLAKVGSLDPFSDLMTGGGDGLVIVDVTGIRERVAAAFAATSRLSSGAPMRTAVANPRYSR